MEQSNLFNWVSNNKKTDVEAASKILSKAKEHERKMAKKGWRWIRLSGKLRIFVPCGKNGKPTKEGRMKIEAMTRNLIGF